MAPFPGAAGQEAACPLPADPGALRVTAAVGPASTQQIARCWLGRALLCQRLQETQLRLGELGRGPRDHVVVLGFSLLETDITATASPHFLAIFPNTRGAQALILRPNSGKVRVAKSGNRNSKDTVSYPSSLPHSRPRNLRCYKIPIFLSQHCKGHVGTVRGCYSTCCRQRQDLGMEWGCAYMNALSGLMPRLQGWCRCRCSPSA